MLSYQEVLDEIDELFNYELDKLDTRSVAFKLYNSKKDFKPTENFLKTQIDAISESEAAVSDFEKNIRGTMKTLEKEATTDDEYQDLSNIYWEQLLDEVDNDLMHALKSTRDWGDWRDEHELLSKLRTIKENLEELESDIRKAYDKIKKQVVLFVFGDD